MRRGSGHPVEKKKASSLTIIPAHGKKSQPHRKDQRLVVVCGRGELIWMYPMR